MSKCEHEVSVEYTRHTQLTEIVCCKPNGCPCKFKSKIRPIYHFGFKGEIVRSRPSMPMTVDVRPTQESYDKILEQLLTI